MPHKKKSKHAVDVSPASLRKLLGTEMSDDRVPLTLPDVLDKKEYYGILPPYRDNDCYTPLLDEVIGEGTFGDIVMAEHKDRYVVAMKMIKPEKVDLVSLEQEVRALQYVGGQCNVITLVDTLTVELPDGERVSALIFPLVNDFQYHYPDDYQELSVDERVIYCEKVLHALQHIHSKGIIHGDIKGENVLFDRDTKTLQLIDFGLAEPFEPTVIRESWPGTWTHMAPELLVQHRWYHYSADMWSFGVMFMYCFTGSAVFREAGSRLDHLWAIIEVLGRKDFLSAMKRHSCIRDDLTGDIVEALHALLTSSDLPAGPVVVWEDELGDDVSPDAVEVLNGLLDYDQDLRLSARDTLKHSFFGGGSIAGSTTTSEQSTTEASTDGSTSNTSTSPGDGDQSTSTASTLST